MKLRKRDLFLLVAAPALMLGAIGTVGTVSNSKPNEAVAAGEKYTFTKITSSSNLTDGIYLIVCEDSGMVFNSSLSTLDSASNGVSVTISNNSINETTSGEWSQYAFTITASNGAIQSNNAKAEYIYNSGDSNGLKTSTTSKTNTISFSTNGDANIVSSKSYLRYNPSANNERFRFFKSTTYTNQKTIQLYKGTVQASTSTESITVSGAASVNKGSTTTVTADKSDGLASSELTWHSSDESVASIDANGVVTGLAAGITTITATCEYNSQTITSNGLTITVIDTTPSLAISADKTEIVVGRNNATISLTPTNCTPDSVTWSSNDTNVATVTGDASSATVKPIAAGDTVIKATYDNGGDAVVSNEIAIHVSTYGEVTVNNYLSLTSANLGVVTTNYAANNGTKKVDGVSYHLNNVQKSTGDKGSGIQLKVEDSLFCNLNAYSKNIYRIKVKLASGETLPNVYACDGLRELNNQVPVSSNEARRTATGYYEFDMSSFASKYFAITSNGNNTPYMSEIVIAFDPDTYLANFDLEGGSMDADEIVPLPESENTITLPTPTRSNYAFAGWFDGENTYEGGAEVTIYKDTSFTALWDNTTILQTLVNGVESKTSLAYRYVSATAVKSNEGLIAGAKYIIGYKADNLQSGAVAGAISNKIMGRVVAGVTEDKVVAVPENASIFTLGGSTGAWTLHTDDGYVEPTAERVLAYKETASASNSWNISVANTGVASIAWSNSSYGSLYYNTSNPRFTTYKSTQASVRLYRVYETPVVPQFRIKVGVTAAIADLATTDGVNECGVAVTAGNTTQRFALSDLHTDDTGIRYVTIDLGDVVNNYSRATTAFMVRAYVKSGEDYIYTTDAGRYKNLSVRDMVNEYHGMNEYRDIVDGLWSFFNAVSAY